MEDEMIPAYVHEVGYTRLLAKSSVGPGWAKLIDKVFDKLEDLTSGSGQILLTPRIVQVKEKFGGLRIYTSGEGNHPIDDFVYEIEIESFTICETCGKPGSLRGGSWYKTLCDEHANGRQTIEPF
jgi:hypothetical protein